MKMYYDRETAPLKYHKYFRYINLPVSILIIIRNTISVLLSMEYYHISYVVSIAYNLTVLACLTICISGIGSWKPSSWKALITYHVLAVCFCFLQLIVALALVPDQILSKVFDFVYSAVLSGLIILYYAKRRPLFFYVQSQTAASSGKHICPTCGKASPTDQRFCRACGTPLHQE